MVSGLLLLLPPPPGHFVVVRVHSVVRSCTAPIFTDFWRVEPWGTLVHIISVYLVSMGGGFEVMIGDEVKQCG